MSDISALYTQQTSVAAPAATGPLAGAGKTGLMGSLDFFDLIFARLTTGEDAGQILKTKPAETTLTAPTPAPKSPDGEPGELSADTLMAMIAAAITLDTGIETANDIAANTVTTNEAANDSAASNAAAILPVSKPLHAITPEIAALLSPAAGTLPQDNTATPVVLDRHGLKKLQATLDTLLQGLPADQRPVVLNITGTQLKAALKRLDIDVADIAASSQSLIATGLSPEDLTTMIDMISNPETDTANENAALQMILTGTVKIVPDGDAVQTIFLPKTLGFSKPNETEPGEEEIAAALNALSVGGDASLAATASPAPATAPAAGTDIDPAGITGGQKARAGFEDVLKLLEDIQNRGAEPRNIAPSSGTPDKTADADAAVKQPGPVNSTLGNGFNGMLGTLMNSTALSDLFPDGMNWSANTGAISSTQVTGTAQLASLVTQAHTATQPHAATQMVAATLTRGAQSGENSTMTLKLNPPELGRIEIQMHFTKDKSVKAHMVFEKPETMLMMQRDAQTLERAMAQAGLDAGGNALSFELSGKENGFGDDRQGHDGNSGRGKSADSGDDAIIETTLSWYVDENTGIQHYNILA